MKMNRNLRKVAAVLFALILFSPHCEARKGFAIIIDAKSLQEAQTEVKAYADAIEQQQGLKVYTITDNWGIPDSIRAILQTLHEQKKDPIVGAVFIGDIPIPMIRDAQHMTSAFKMSQEMDRRESSVPSDRFYDDFKLRFVPQGKDAELPYFYYSLSGKGTQVLNPDIFSGRIRPTDAGGTSRYEKLRLYLRKATQFKLHPETFNNYFVFNGNGSLSESNVAHIDEFRGLNEHFPQFSQKPESYSYMEYTEEPFIKTKMVNELMRPDLSFAMLHHHGDWDTQYLSGYPKPRNVNEAMRYIQFTTRDRVRTYLRWGLTADSAVKKVTKMYNVPEEWARQALSAQYKRNDSIFTAQENLTLTDFVKMQFKPNVRMANFDACYNGSFHMDDCIANSYIFQPGKTLVTLGGTVNVLQDKWPDRFVGLLAEGMMVGFLAQNTIYLEWHVIGDPTCCFAPKDKSDDVNRLMGDNNPKSWSNILKKKTGSVDLQAMAIHKLSGNPLLSNQHLLQLLQNSPYAMIRLEAFLALKARGGEDFIQAIQIASKDNYELVQRFAVNEIQNCGDQRLIPVTTRLLTKNNASARVKFNAMHCLQFLEAEPVKIQMQKSWNEVAPYLTAKDSIKSVVFGNIDKYCGTWDEDIDKLCQGKYNNEQALKQANYMRIYLPAYKIPEVVAYTDTCTDMQLKKNLLEALGWHGTAYTADRIRELALRTSQNDTLPAGVRDEALKTFKRTSFVKL
jgi:hypothetical protein